MEEKSEVKVLNIKGLIGGRERNGTKNIFFKLESHSRSTQSLKSPYTSSRWQSIV